MGQTLSNGVYLPNEGERNCYAGLASNWQILNTAVGSIAEKAPLVHTHTVSQITDFPVYGTTAGTICEGNDSRLSDARTPVAHTHGKADITDLFNSANTWSGEQTFSVPCKTLGKKLLTGITDLDDAYYNGEVSGFNPNTLHSPTGGYGNVLTINNAVNVPDNAYNSWITQIATASDDAYLGVRKRSNGGAWTSWTKILTESNAIPTVTNTYDLGTSTNKWKSLNGVNPGALSLPDLSVAQGVDKTGWVYDGTTLNSVLLNSGDTNVTKNGWLYIRTNSTVSGDRMGVRLSNIAAEYPTTIVGEIGFGHIEVFIPIVAGYKAYVFTNKAPTYVKFYPCLGNVPSGV